MSTDNLHNVDEILDRVKEVKKLNTDAKLAEFLGVKPGTVSAWRSRNSLDLKLILAKCKDFDANYIVHGPEVHSIQEPEMEYVHSTEKSKWPVEVQKDYEDLLKWVMPSDMPMKQKIATIQAFVIVNSDKYSDKR